MAICLVCRYHAKSDQIFPNGIHITVPSPVLGNVKGPLELQVGMVIIIDKLGDGIVVTTGNHAGRSFLVVN